MFHKINIETHNPKWNPKAHQQVCPPTLILLFQNTIILSDHYKQSLAST
jgi:hypothetical protein